MCENKLLNAYFETSWGMKIANISDKNTCIMRAGIIHFQQKSLSSHPYKVTEKASYWFNITTPTILYLHLKIGI